MAAKFALPSAASPTKNDVYYSVVEVEDGSKSPSPFPEMVIERPIIDTNRDSHEAPARPKRICNGALSGIASELPSLALMSGPKGEAEVILDYGRAEGGLPFFDVFSIESEYSTVQFDVVYSESRNGIEHDEGDGPYFLFSNAMNTYRREFYSVAPTQVPVRIYARFAQQSQRYQRIILKTRNSSIKFTSIGLRPLRGVAAQKGVFETSDEMLNRIFQSGRRTADMCTLEPRETQEAWQVASEGTRVYGQHWAPCRHGSRWKDINATFEVKIDQGGASWAVHMVTNGLIFVCDVDSRTIEVFEGLSHLNGVFPTVKKASWILPSAVKVLEWIAVETTTIGASCSLRINAELIGTIEELAIRPLLGGSENNSGSIAFGGPNGFEAVYRNLVVTTHTGTLLYSNDLSMTEKERILEDFSVGTNSVACTMDGAKRDRATFAGDLYVMARAIYHSTGNVEAVLGSLKLLTSHQTAEGYLGNLCPVQAPLHDTSEDPPTYAFYSLSYALLLITAIKDYWMHTGDENLVRIVWSKLEKLLQFTCTFLDARGLVVAPPPLSMDWFPMAGPSFGASAKINLTYLEALTSMRQMQECLSLRSEVNYFNLTGNIRKAINCHLWDPITKSLRVGDNVPLDSYLLDVHGYSSTLGTSPNSFLAPFQLDDNLPLSFKNNPRLDHHKVVSPYAIGFLVEAYFMAGDYTSALNLIKRVWGPMTDPRNQDYSGGHWEAMNEAGEPYGHDTSLVHGWSTWPTFLLPKYLGGLEIVEAGWRKWRCAPVLTGGLESLNVGVMTPYGLAMVQVGASAVEGTGFMTLKVPLGTAARVSAPSGWTFVGEEPRDSSEEGTRRPLVLQGRAASFHLPIFRSTS